MPSARPDALRRVATPAGFDFRREEDELAVEGFADAGLNLHDYQQNFLVDQAVKVSFFVPEPPLASVLSAQAEEKAHPATLAELSKSKSLVSALRSKTRDWLDLYLLLRDHGFSIDDFQEVFRPAGVEAQCATALSRLCSGVPQKDDEGLVHRIANPLAS